MLLAARSAVKSVDPGAKIVLAGLTNYSWKDLAAIYKVPGARGAFDVVAIHPYTKQPQGVIKLLGFAHGVMSGNGDGGKPLIADEISWPSSVGQTHNYFSWVTTPTEQARDVTSILPLLARNRVRLHLAGFYYYTWAGRQYRNANPWNFAGLFDFTGEQSDRQARVRRVQASRAGPRALPSQGGGHPLRLIARAQEPQAGETGAGASARRKPEAKAEVSGLRPPPGGWMPNQSCGLARLRPGVTQV